MNVLVCGGRDFQDYGIVQDALSKLPFDIDVIIQGGAKGADALAKRYARSESIHCAEIPALWDDYGRNAGWMRNEAMLLLKIDYCVAFAGGKGTADMVRRCLAKGIPVWDLRSLLTPTDNT